LARTNWRSQPSGRQASSTRRATRGLNSTVATQASARRISTPLSSRVVAQQGTGAAVQAHQGEAVVGVEQVRQVGQHGALLGRRRERQGLASLRAKRAAHPRRGWPFRGMHTTRGDTAESRGGAKPARDRLRAADVRLALPPARPLRRGGGDRIHAHVAITVLALLLERTVEPARDDAWRNVSGRLRRIQLARRCGPHGTVRQATEPSPETAQHLNSLQIKPGPAVLRID
jgi:hypothetical protein